MRDPELSLHRKKALPPRRKKFGVEQWSRWLGKWCFPTWYVTEKARDQAYENLMTKTSPLRSLGHDLLARKVHR